MLVKPGNPEGLEKHRFYDKAPLPRSVTSAGSLSFPLPSPFHSPSGAPLHPRPAAPPPASSGRRAPIRAPSPAVPRAPRRPRGEPRPAEARPRPQPAARPPRPACSPFSSRRSYPTFASPRRHSHPCGDCTTENPARIPCSVHGVSAASVPCGHVTLTCVPNHGGSAHPNRTEDTDGSWGNR